MAEPGQTVEALQGTRHLAQFQKIATENAKFIVKMFSGRIAAGILASRESSTSTSLRGAQLSTTRP